MSEFTWTPDRIIHYPLIDHVHLSPNGGRVLFTVRTAHLTADTSEFRNQIMVALTEGDNEPVQLTFGEMASQPSWSPDGRHMAFLRSTPGGSKGAGLWVMRLVGGEPWLLTGAGTGVHNAITRFAWSPDGKQLAFLSTPHEPEHEKQRQQRADVFHWRVDYDFEHLFVVDFAAPSGATNPTPIAKQLTQGRFHVLNLSWSPDGARLAFAHRSTPLLESWPQTRLATIAADGSELAPTDLGAAPNKTGAVDYSPDGQWIATDVSTEGSAWAYASRVALFPGQGGEPVFLADVPDAQPDVLGWAPDGNAVYVLNQQGLGSQVLAVPVDGGPVQFCIEGEFQFDVVHVNSFGQAALVMHNFYEINSVYIADLTGIQGPHTPTSVATPGSQDYLQGVLPQVRILHWRTPDGFEIEGILYLPHDYEEQNEQKLPLLLHIHGGPASIFQRQFAGHPYYYTPAAFCERGIAVLRCNPRGSGGYGKDFRFANRHDWGEGDYRDLQQGVDEVLRLGIVDPERLGICGWSYGGFMTSWALTQTERFRAASIGAPVINPMTFNATSDIPSFVPDYFGGDAWEDMAFYQAHSPIFQVHRVQTPAIIQHGDADARVPLEQALQFFHALKRRGIPVEMYIYPRQGHAIHEPRLLADALQRNLDWFTQMLLEE